MGSCITCYSCVKKAKVSRFVIVIVKLRYTETLTTIISIASRIYLQIDHYQRESHFTHGFSSGCGGQKARGMSR